VELLPWKLDTVDRVRLDKGTVILHTKSLCAINSKILPWLICFTKIKGTFNFHTLCGRAIEQDGDQKNLKDNLHLKHDKSLLQKF